MAESMTDPNGWVMCTACGSAFDLAAARIPSAGMVMRCPVCGERFQVDRNALRAPPNPEHALHRELQAAAAEGRYDDADQLRERLHAERAARVRSSP